MPALGQRKPPVGDRLSDRISLGVLTRTFPAALIDRVIEETEKKEQRHRLLPARVTMYFVLAMCLFCQENYVEVMALLAKGLNWVSDRATPYTEPSDTALVNARRRLGSAPLVALFKAAVKPLATATTIGATYGRWRLLAIDGTVLDTPDTPENDAAFGRPGTGRAEGVGGFPQARVVGLVELGAHAFLDAVVGGCNGAEVKLVPALFHSIAKNTLLLADRGFWSFELWQQAAATGADLLWRTKKNVILPVVKELADGSYLSEIFAAHDDRRKHPVSVRVVEYTLEGSAKDTIYRLVTTILDPDEAPAVELAGLYTERREIESVFDEVKTHQRGRQVVLRSKSPDGVLQEIWGHLLVHYAVRSLMVEAAAHRDIDHDRLSFLSSLRIIRRPVTEPAAFSPSGHRQTHRRRNPRDMHKDAPRATAAFVPAGGQAQDEQVRRQARSTPRLSQPMMPADQAVRIRPASKTKSTPRVPIVV